MKLSICIPTYNRAGCLANCLQSIASNAPRSRLDIQVCVSDNCSTDETEAVVRRAQEAIDINYHKCDANLGRSKNYINVVNMADGDFVWLLGDDDLLMPYALARTLDLINQHPDVDFYFINSFHLTTEYIATFPQPFDTANLPSAMLPFSSWPTSKELMFMDLVDPKFSFDFLGGMFLAVFRRERWLENVNALDEAAISDGKTFSHFDNTFPHLKIFSKAFAKSRAYFCAMPLSVCLTGAREWAPMTPLIFSVRLIEALDEHRRNGLPYVRYWRCKNYALRFFLPHMVKMMLNRDISGWEYIRPTQLILSNCWYPNSYLSLVYFVTRKLYNSWTWFGHWFRNLRTN